MELFGLRKSTWLWINIVSIALNFTGLALSGVTRMWIFFGVHCFALIVSQLEINRLIEDLDKKEIENE